VTWIRAGRSGNPIPAGARYFCVVHIFRTGCGDSPSLLFDGYRRSFPEVKRPERDAENVDRFWSTVAATLRRALEFIVHTLAKQTLKRASHSLVDLSIITLCASSQDIPSTLYFALLFILLVPHLSPFSLHDIIRL
jgi:hypothetical protein